MAKHYFRNKNIQRIRLKTRCSSTVVSPCCCLSMVMSSVTELPLQTQSSRLPSALAVKDTKQTTEAPHVCVCVYVCLFVRRCCDLWVTVERREMGGFYWRRGRRECENCVVAHGSGCDGCL